MLGIVFVVLAGGAIVASLYATQQARKRAIEDTFRTLGAEPVRVREAPLGLGTWAVQGRVHGLTLRYALRAGGKNTPNRTLCDAMLSAPTELEMELRPETAREVRHVEHGRAIDLALGDEAFDDSFIVEAAPSDMARALLDRSARTALLSFHPCVLTLTRGQIRFVKNGYLDEPAEIARVLELCADLGSRLGTLPAQLLERRLAEGRGESFEYRGATPAAMRTLARSPEDASELAALHEAVAKRKRLTWGVNLAIIVVAVIAGIVLASVRR